MLFELRDRLAHALSELKDVDDHYTTTIDNASLLRLCERIIEELYERSFIDFRSTRVRYKKRFREIDDHDSLRQTISFGIMSYEEQSGQVVTTMLVAYDEMTTLILNALAKDSMILAGDS